MTNNNTRLPNTSVAELENFKPCTDEREDKFMSFDGKRTDRVEVRVAPLVKELFGDAADEKGFTLSGYLNWFMEKEAKRMQKKILLEQEKTLADSEQRGRTDAELV